MSSALIASLLTGSPDVVKKNINELISLIEENKLGEKDTNQLCKNVIKLVEQSPPSVLRAVHKLAQNLLSIKVPNTFPIDLIEAVKGQIATENCDEAMATVRCIIDKISPKEFWTHASDFLSDRRPTLVANVTALLTEFLEEDSSFTVGSASKVLIANLINANKNVRDASFEAIKIIHERKPQTTEKMINKYIPGDAAEFIDKLGPHKKKAAESVRSSSIMGESEILSANEIAAGLELDFDQAGIEIEPIKKGERLSTFEKALSRTTDWEKTQKALNDIVGICKGSTTPKKTVSELKLIIVPIVDCARNARSALCKTACLDIVAIAEALKNALDSLSVFIIPPLLKQTNHGTAVIALSSKYAVKNYVSYVCGKNTKSALISGYQSKNREARLTVIESMIVAVNNWPPDMTEEFRDIIVQARKDKNDEIRRVASMFDIDTSSFISSVSQTSTRSRIPVMSSSKDSGKTPMKKSHRESGITPLKKKHHEEESGITPLKKKHHEEDSGLTPLKRKHHEEDSGLTPLKKKKGDTGITPLKKKHRDEDTGLTPLKKSAAKESGITPLKKKKSESGVTPLKQTPAQQEVETTEIEIDLEEDIPEEDNEQEMSDAIDEMILNSDSNALIELLTSQEPDLFGKIEEIICLAKTESSLPMPNNAPKIIEILTTKYRDYLFSYINLLIENLPDDESCGKQIIELLSKCFGNSAIALLLYSSNIPYAYSYVLEHALKTKDINTMSRSVVKTIENGAYEQNVGIIVEILQLIYEEDNDKVEMILASIPVEQRNNILPDIESKMPFIVSLFKEE